MSLPPTFDSLLAQLRARLGFVSIGGAAHGNDLILSSVLQEAHAACLLELPECVPDTVSVLRTEPGETLYDCNDDDADAPIDAHGLQSVHCVCGESGLLPLQEGIPAPAHARQLIGYALHEDQIDQPAGWPTHYEMLGGQLRLWPCPQEVYELHIRHRTPGRFRSGTDRPVAPWELVFAYALSMAKAHYRQPDAQSLAASYQSMLARHKARRHGSRRYFAQSAPRGADTAVVQRVAQGHYVLIGG